VRYGSFRKREGATWAFLLSQVHVGHLSSSKTLQRYRTATIHYGELHSSAFVSLARRQRIHAFLLLPDCDLQPQTRQHAAPVHTLPPC
jgi:hypothetical protein